MANPSYRTYTTAGAQDPWNVDWVITTFNVSVLAYVVSGTASYSIEYTLDDLNGDLPVRWVETDAAPAGTSATKLVWIEYPVRAVRMNIAVVTGSIEMKCLQGLPD